MDNSSFLEVLKKSFYKYLHTGARSTEKLKVLHGAVAKDVAERLGDEYKIYSLGYEQGKERNVEGRYMNKRVDITVEKDGQVVAGIALKFIMSNYSQNSVNYFENMLGETVNIRCSGKPYFQIIIIPTIVPYFKDKGTINKYEFVTEHNIEKYIKISNENISTHMHTPNKTLMYLVDFSKLPSDEVRNKEELIQFYDANTDMNFSESDKEYIFGDNFIYNNYEEYIKQKIYVKNNNNIYEEFISKEDLADYSTWETKIGTWIDGKPLYRKVIDGITPNTTTDTEVFNIPNIATLVNIKGMIANWLPINSIVSPENSSILYFQPDSFMMAIGSSQMNKPFRAIVEYTKTTD